VSGSGISWSYANLHLAPSQHPTTILYITTQCLSVVLTLCMIGSGSPTSMGIDVLWTHVLVHRWRRRTYALLHHTHTHTHIRHTCQPVKTYVAIPHLSLTLSTDTYKHPLSFTNTLLSFTTASNDVWTIHHGGACDDQLYDPMLTTTVLMLLRG